MIYWIVNISNDDIVRELLTNWTQPNWKVSNFRCQKGTCISHLPYIYIHNLFQMCHISYKFVFCWNVPINNLPWRFMNFIIRHFVNWYEPLGTNDPKSLFCLQSICKIVPATGRNMIFSLVLYRLLRCDILPWC